MELNLGGKVALVAAASRGLGRAVAEELAEEGASLILCARGEDLLRQTCDEIHQKSNVPVLGVAADLSKTEDVERLFHEATEQFGEIDILVTNVGGPPTAAFENITRESWKEAHKLLLTSVLDLTRLVLPQMKARRWGRILNITSIAAKQPVANLILSNSLRAAVTGFAKTLADEVAPFGITVNNILPGYTRTERVEQLARTIAEKEFAALAAFLVSERASYITGSSIAVDGGWIRSLF
jgi:3-oxoacyl-[acyl-carrier protein] reductase